jgi:hypothetical protein
MSTTAVHPLAALPVDPDDFPFLDRVCRHEVGETEPALRARLRAALA